MNIQEMLSSIFKGKEDKIIGNEIVEQRGDNVVRISLATGKVADNYDNIRILIINKNTLNQVEKHIKFEDVFKKEKRADNRDDYNGEFHIWHNNNEYHWYIAIPTEDAISELVYNCYSYINMFR